jgi:hypothetical protein
VLHFKCYVLRKRGTTVGESCRGALRAPVLKTAVPGGRGWLLRGLPVLRARAHAVAPLRCDVGSVVIPDGAEVCIPASRSDDGLSCGDGPPWDISLSAEVSASLSPDVERGFASGRSILFERHFNARSGTRSTGADGKARGRSADGKFPAADCRRRKGCLKKC